MYRNKEIKIRLTEKELARLDRNVARVGISREGYIRTILSGYEPQTSPPKEFYVYLRILRALCDEINKCRFDIITKHPELYATLSEWRQILGKLCDELQSISLPKKSETQKPVI